MNIGNDNYSIGEVAKITGLKPSVLRFWETQFEILQPKKNKFGHRVYGAFEIFIINVIKDALYEEGLTIKGVQKKLSSSVEMQNSSDDECARIVQLKKSHYKTQLKDIVDELRELKIMSSRNVQVDVQLQELRSLVSVDEQVTILKFWDELSQSEKDFLYNQIKSIDFEKVSLLRSLLDPKLTEMKAEVVEPAAYISIEQRTEEALSVGIKALQAGEVAFLTVAGGQASRLGIEKPKGCFGISPVMKKSLFQIFAEKIKFYQEAHQQPMRWYIMTSEENYQETLTFFEEHNYFELPHATVVFFKQGMLPSLDLKGHLLLKDKCSLFLNPDGHGGILTALHREGLINQMIDDNIRYLSYFQVDNPLVNMADPHFIGNHILESSDVSTKVITKAYPEEKLGSIVKSSKTGKNKIIEYSEMTPEMMHATSKDGSLYYAVGSIGIHVFSTEFLRDFTDKLPIHMAKKKIPTLDPETATVIELDAFKFESLVFDTIPLAKKSLFFETKREEEFSPLKNATGVDSIETTIQGQSKLHRLWLERAGLKLPNDIKLVEISPLFAPDSYFATKKLFSSAREKIQRKLAEKEMKNEQIYID